jgi:threonine dehydrogenase-like Zn-dependent dehydrogenase
VKALRFAGGKLEVSELPVPQRAGEALVKVELAGICSTDLHILRGYAGFAGTLGHEFVGLVEDSPDPDLIGQRVVGEINAGCGACDLCWAGDPRHCAQRTVLGIEARDGAFAEYLSLPSENLLVIPAGVSDREAVFTEPLAAACEILDQVRVKASHRVAVIGDGKLGQLIARVLATTECDLTLIGKYEDKLRLAEEIGIKTEQWTAEEGGSVSHTRRQSLSLCDVVVEASGAASGFDLALNLVRPRGTIVLKSTFNGAVPLEAWRVVVNEISIVGSRCGRFSRALDLLADRAVDVEPLIADEYPLAEGVAAMEAAARPGALKVLLRP